MRYIRYAILVPLAVFTIVVALANRQLVELNTLPEGLQTWPFAELLTYSITMPLFFVFFGGIALGLILGQVFEYLREHKIRRESREKTKKMRRLERDLKKTQSERDKDKDEVLAILDQAS